LFELSNLFLILPPGSFTLMIIDLNHNAPRLSRFKKSAWREAKQKEKKV
jgi:hypothetical protein